MTGVTDEASRLVGRGEVVEVFVRVFVPLAVLLATHGFWVICKSRVKYDSVLFIKMDELFSYFLLFLTSLGLNSSNIINRYKPSTILSYRCNGVGRKYFN